MNWLAFWPELLETVCVGGQKIRGLFLPYQGAEARRKRFRADTGVELEERDQIVINRIHKVEVGDTLIRQDKHYRVMSKIEYPSFNIFTLERIQGNESHQPILHKAHHF